MAAAATSTAVRSLLHRAHSPDSAETIFKDKIQYKPLHLRATSPNPTTQDARAQRRLVRQRKREKASRRRPKPKPLSGKEKRVSGVYDIPKELQKHDIYVPLHEMWVKYMWDVLGFKEGQQSFINAGGSGNMLATADYHGAKVTISRSRCSSLVNLKGIVAKDTKFTFQIITEKDDLKSGSLSFSDDSYLTVKQLYPSEAVPSDSKFHNPEMGRTLISFHHKVIISRQCWNLWHSRWLGPNLKSDQQTELGRRSNRLRGLNSDALPTYRLLC